MNDMIVAVCGADCGVTPPMPYVGEKFDGKVFTEKAKLLTEAALLRCGFDVIDVCNATAEPQDAVMAANRGGADYTVVLSYSSFGSGRSFNDVSGCTVYYAPGRTGKASRVLAEDICAFLASAKHCEVAAAHPGWSCALRPTVAVCGGYLTDFDDAKLIYDPDHAAAIAERIAMGLCENTGTPYIPRADIKSYPTAAAVSPGKRGKKVKLLQTLLSACGYVLTPDGVFGKNTELALARFNADNGIDDGVCETVWEKLLLLDPKDVPIGSTAAEVRYIQLKLHSKLYVAPLDGRLDERTLSALDAYLSDIGEGAHADNSGAGRDAIVLLSKIGGGKPRLF